MPEDKKDEKNAESCARRCGGCKFLAGVLVGLLVAGTALGIYLAGRCSGHKCGFTHSMCPFSSQSMPQPTQAEPSK